MTKEEKRQIIMDAKYARIINDMSEMYHVSIEKAMDIFYNSENFGLTI